MKKKFLTVDSYSTGGIWIYVYAHEANEIRIKYPKLSIVNHPPKWLIDFEKNGNTLRTIDIDEETPEKLVYLKG